MNIKIYIHYNLINHKSQKKSKNFYIILELKILIKISLIKTKRSRYFVERCSFLEAYTSINKKKTNIITNDMDTMSSASRGFSLANARNKEIANTERIKNIPILFAFFTICSSFISLLF